MTLVLQGMRRSGTTIVYDALDQDPELSLWYEPLAAARKPAIGGGSGAREVDVFERVRAAREAFLATRAGASYDDLNLGAPRDASLEFDRGIPPLVADYLRFLFERPGPVAAKFTRLFAKVPALHRIAPAAGFVLLVRDPRAVAVSYLFGKNRRNEKHASPLEVFFGRRTERSAWSSYPISELVRREYADERLPEPTDLERVLLIWRFTFERAWRDAQVAYGERAIILRHEDFCADPDRELRRIHDLDGRSVPDPVAAWARANVRSPGAIHAEGDPRWRDAFERMGMIDLLADSGYAAAI
jgi:hypothetical protein